jgi:hypothetical protein
VTVLALSPESVVEARFVQFLRHFFGLPPKRAVLGDFSLCSVSGIRARTQLLAAATVFLLLFDLCARARDS